VRLNDREWLSMLVSLGLPVILVVNREIGLFEYAILTR